MTLSFELIPPVISVMLDDPKLAHYITKEKEKNTILILTYDQLLYSTVREVYFLSYNVIWRTEQSYIQLFTVLFVVIKFMVVWVLAWVAIVGVTDL